jgi:hypothetical protein
MQLKHHSPQGIAASWQCHAFSACTATAAVPAGLVEPYNRPDQIEGDPVLRDGNGSLPVLPKVSMAELPKYKCVMHS